MTDIITDIALSQKLASSISELYQIGLEFMTANPDYALLKFREAEEILVRLLADHHHFDQQDVSLFARIKLLHENQIISHPMCNDLHLVRKLGNAGAHSFESVQYERDGNSSDRQTILLSNAVKSRRALISVFEQAFILIHGYPAAKTVKLVPAGQQEFRNIIYDAMFSHDYQSKLKAGIVCESIGKENSVYSPLVITESFKYHLENNKKIALAFYDSACKISADLDQWFLSNPVDTDIELAIQSRGDVEAIFRYASISLLSEEDLDTKKLALARLTFAADRGYVPAQALIGAYFYEQSQYESAFRYLSDAEKMDEPLALRFLFYYFSDGKACEQNAIMALDFLNRGITLGCPDCEAELGYQYRLGVLMDQSDELSHKCLENARLAGSYLSKKYILILTIQDIPNKTRQYLAAFEQVIAASKSQPIKRTEKTPRNDPCPCGSGQKYKKCCLNKNLTQFFY